MNARFSGPLSSGASEAQTLERLLGHFSPISLEEMDAVALLNRIDSKFLLTPGQLLEALTHLHGAYRVLSVNHERLNLYRTLYFDTPDFALYRVHHNGSQDRFKVRFRTYVDSNLTYFEVKRKNNKGRTFKRRLRMLQEWMEVTQTMDEFLHTALSQTPARLEPKLWNHFARITLVSTEQIERLTVDVDLEFSNQEQGTQVPNLVIAEVKQSGSGHNSRFIQQMRMLHAEQLSFSKYCIGAALLYPQLKYNNFKPIFLRLDKMGATPLFFPIER